MRRYYPCKCCDIGHCLVVEKFDDLDDKTYSFMAVISGQQTIRNRLKCMWNILIGNEYITSDVMLDMENVVKLRDDLTTIIELVENKNEKEILDKIFQKKISFEDAMEVLGKTENELWEMIDNYNYIQTKEETLRAFRILKETEENMRKEK